MAVRPIGQFGIGILSCFGVAERIEVRTRADGFKPISVAITGLHDEFHLLPDHRQDRGSAIKLNLKPGGPLAASSVPPVVEKYVRHARYVWLDNVDSGDSRLVPEQWLSPGWAQRSGMTSEAIESGHIELTDAWTSIQRPFDVSVVLCNAGFLVRTSALGLLHPWASGVRAEINFRPGALNILMNREDFQQDEKWKTVADQISAEYRRLVLRRFTEWEGVTVGDHP